MTEIDTGTDDLLARREGQVGVITFNRPDRRNALSNAMYHGFRAVLPAFATDPDIRVVLITGEGGAFCAGGDVKGMNEANQSGRSRDGQPSASRCSATPRRPAGSVRSRSPTVLSPTSSTRR